jgi:hypothetical protein
VLPIKEHPELFPPEIAFGYKMKEIRVSKKLNLKIRRIVIAGVSYTIRPSFAMPYMTLDQVAPHLTVVELEFVIKMKILRTFCNLSCMSSYESENCFLSP